MPIILLLFFVPFLCSLGTLLIPRPLRNYVKFLGVGMSLLPLAIMLANHGHLIGSTVAYDWIPILSIKFHLSIDALTLLFLYLTAIVIPISLTTIKSDNLKDSPHFFALVLFLQGLLIGFFSARDLAVFTLFWEAMLIPLYFIIGLWGGPNRHMASLKFILYMIGGSALLIAAVLALYFNTGAGTFNMDTLAKTASQLPSSKWILAIFLLAFAVKTPLFPFHAWLPDAYCQAPTAGTILLSAILSKAGIYGILRVGMGLFPELLKEWSPILLGLAIAGVFYGGLAAWSQKDYKRLIAYSSFSHVNFVLAGLFIWNQTAQMGGLLQAVNHGLTITALFMTAGWLEDRLGTTSLSAYSGLAKFMPHLCWLTLFFVLSSIALPGTNNFIGEFMVFFGLFGENPWQAALLALTVILSALYMLRYMQSVYFAAPGLFDKNWIDIHRKELAVALPLVVLIMWIGLYPAPVLQEVKQAAEKFVTIAKQEQS